MYVLLAAISTFPGGNFNDLAHSMASATGKPAVVVLSASKGAMKSFQFDPSNLDSLTRTVQKEAGLVRTPGLNMVFHDGLVPSGKVSRNPWNSPEAVAAKAFPSDAIKNGLVTVRTEKNESLDVQTLKGFKKPVQVHWFYGSLAIGIEAKDVPEMDFLSLVAKGMAARFLNTSNAYLIDFDPVEARLRVVQTIQSEPLTGDKAAQDRMAKERAFRIAALNALSSADMTTLFQKQGNEIRVAVRNGSPVEGAAVALIRDVEATERAAAREQRQEAVLEYQTTGAIRVSRAGNQDIVGILNRIDSRRPATLIVNTMFEVGLELPIFDARGRPTTQRLFMGGGQTFQMGRTSEPFTFEVDLDLGGGPPPPEALTLY